jgi:hypothetical protein
MVFEKNSKPKFITMEKIFTTSKTISFILALSILLSSCASTTLIDSVPTGADLYLDGEYAGVTPHSMTDTKLIGTCTTVRIEKENFHNFHSSICRTEEADPAAIIGGIFFFFPFFWAMKYKPTHFYKLQPNSGKGESIDQAKSGNDDSLDQLWKTESKEKGQKMSVEDQPQTIDQEGIIKLEDGKEITPEEFEQQKQNKPE